MQNGESCGRDVEYGLVTWRYKSTVKLLYTLQHLYDRAAMPGQRPDDLVAPGAVL